tara:strand:- start:131 stop:1783 length:1653 start_codon:yes stop_codon:yes gene_type:complete
MADYLEKKYFHRYGFSEGGKEWGEMRFDWMPTVNEWRPYNEDDPLAENDLELFIEEKEYELVNQMLDDENSRLHKFFINNPRYVEEEEFDTNYKVLNEDGEIEKLGFLISWGEPDIEYRKSQYSTDPETPLYRFEFLNAEDQSAYWFLKGEMQSRAPLNQMDLEQILEMLQNVPKKEMNEAMEQAEMMGDEAAMIVLIMADNKRKFREEYASEDEPSVEKSTAYFSKLKSQNPDLARKIEFSVKNEDELPTEEIEKAGFQEDKVEEWVDLVGVEDSNLVGFERCSDCEGEGFIITNYYPATRYDPADGDFEECEICYGSGEIDPADYMDKDGNYMAESFEAESSKRYFAWENLINAIIEDVFRKFKIKKSHSYDDILKSQPKDGEDDVFIAHGSRRFRCSFDGKGKCFELSKAAMSDSLLKYVSDNDYGLWRYFPTEETKDKVKAYQEKLRKKFDLPIELFVKETYHDEEYGYEPSLIMGVSVGKSEKNEMLGRKKAESHADRQLEESIKRTKLSAIRTGLAITTFGIVMLNLWINRKQSQQIDNLNKKD